MLQNELLHETWWDELHIYPSHKPLYFFRFRVRGVKNSFYTVVSPREKLARNYIVNVDLAHGDEEIESVFEINRATKELIPTDKWAR